MKFKKLFACCLAFAFVGMACGCNGVGGAENSSDTQSNAEQDENLNYELVKADGKVIITITKNNHTKNVKLMEIMERLQLEGKFSYQISDGMVTQIDDVANTSSSYWMLYTDHETFSNTEWGTLEYNGKTYASAMFGADTMPATNGVTYVWSYETPSW